VPPIAASALSNEEIGFGAIASCVGAVSIGAGATSIGAGPRTHLIDDARSDVWDRSFKYGCKDQQIDELLAVYHNELEPTFR